MNTKLTGGCNPWLAMAALVPISLGATPGAIAQTPPTPTPLVTEFRCVTSGKNFATIAARGTRVTPPMILWTKIQGGLTPQQRCQSVTANLNRAVMRSGGRLSRLSLTHGTVNANQVICFLSSRDLRKICSDNNIVLTLRPEDSPEEILKQIRSFSISANTPPITRGEQNNEIYDFGLAVEHLLADESQTSQTP